MVACTAMTRTLAPRISGALPSLGRHSLNLPTC